MMIRHFESAPDLDRFNEVFDKLWQGGSRAAAGQFIPLDILEKGEALWIRASLPGVRPEDVDVQLEGRVLTLKASTRTEGVFSEAKVYRREVPSGDFNRSIRLPEGLALDQTSAEFQNGLLEIRIPRAEAMRARAIRVEVKPMVEARDLEGETTEG
jgi:HSP20 family protein